MRSNTAASKHPHSPFRWWAALVAALVLLLASLAAGARYLGWL